MELNLAKVVKDNKKGFYKHIGGKRKTKENVGPLLKNVGYLVTQNTEKAEVLNVRLAFRNPRSQKLGGKDRRKEYLPLLEEDRFREYLSKLDMHQSMDSDGMHSQALMELTDVIARPLLIIFD